LFVCLFFFFFVSLYNFNWDFFYIFHLFLIINKK
jgi:hypothetical protein